MDCAVSGTNPLEDGSELAGQRGEPRLRCTGGLWCRNTERCLDPPQGTHGGSRRTDATAHCPLREEGTSFRAAGLRLDRGDGADCENSRLRKHEQ